MKKTLLLLLVIISSSCYSQISFTNATTNVQVNRGSVIIDSSFAMPTSADYHHPHPWGRLSGRIIYSLADSIPRFYNGAVWSKFLSEGKAKQSQLINDMGYLTSETDPLFNTKLATKTTDDLNEGITNQYFTQSRARNSISAGTGINYNSSTGVLNISKRQETYSGTTNSIGNYTVTFGTAYSVAPNIQVNVISNSTNVYTRTTVSTTGFTINVFQRGILNVALVGDVLAGAVTNVNGASVDVLITEK